MSLCFLQTQQCLFLFLFKVEIIILKIHVVLQNVIGFNKCICLGQKDVSEISRKRKQTNKKNQIVLVWGSLALFTYRFFGRQEQFTAGLQPCSACASLHLPTPCPFFSRGQKFELKQDCLKKKSAFDNSKPLTEYSSRACPQSTHTEASQVS